MIEIVLESFEKRMGPDSMIFQSIIKVLSTVFMIVLLSACQSVEKNTKLIAGTFNTATNIQMKMLDCFAPPDVIVHQ